MVLALGGTGVQNTPEAGGDGKLEDNGDRSGEANGIIVDAVMEEVVLKGARDAGDKQKERGVEVVVDGGTIDCSATCDEKEVAQNLIGAMP